MINAQQLTKSPTSAQDILPTPPLTSIKKSSTERSRSFVDQLHGAHQDPNSPGKTHHLHTSRTDSKASAQMSNHLIQSAIDWLMRHVEIDHVNKAVKIFNQLLNEPDPSHAEKSLTQKNIDKRRINECICAALFAAQPPQEMIIKSIKPGDLAVDFIAEIARTEEPNTLVTIGFDPFEPPQKKESFQDWLAGTYSKHVDNKKVTTNDNGVRCPVIGALDLRNTQQEDAKNILEKIKDQRQSNYGNLVVIHPDGKVKWHFQPQILLDQMLDNTVTAKSDINEYAINESIFFGSLFEQKS